MLRCEVTDAAILGEDVRSDWSRLRAGDRVLASPYLAPEWYEAVAAVTRTARLGVITEAGRIVGLLPFQDRGWGFAGPIGGHLSDIHGLVAPPGLATDPADMLQDAGIQLLTLRHAPIGQASLGVRFPRPHAFYAMDLSQGYAAYEARREPYAKSAFRALRVRAGKAEKLYGSVTHRFREADPRQLDTLIGWKQAQYASSGQTAVFDFAWVRELVHRLHSSRDPALAGQLSCLYFGDRLVAAHFGLRTPDVLHYWFPGYDPAFAELSPGNILLKRMAEAAAAEGVRALHLGPGEYRYKLELADHSLPVVEGIAFGRSLTGRTAEAAGRAVVRIERTLPAAIASLPSRAMRRIDRHLAFRAA